MNCPGPLLILTALAKSPIVNCQSSFFVAGYENHADTGFDYLLVLLEPDRARPRPASPAPRLP
jgi:hypothetical protein